MSEKTPREIVEEAKAYRERWGMHGFGSRIDIGELTDAAIKLLEEEDSQGETVPKEEITHVTRQLTAAKAREGKLKKQIEQLKSDLRNAQLTGEG